MQSAIFLLTASTALGSLLLASGAQASFQGAYPPTCTPDRKFCAGFAPSDMPIHAVIGSLKSARRSIRIITYNMDVAEMIPVLQDRLQNGVKIEFGVDYKLSFGSNLVWRSLQPHRNLLKYRIPVWRGGSPQMHNKVIVIDDEVVLFGSANWTYSGLVANYETVLAVRDAATIRAFGDEISELRDNSLTACRELTQSPAGCGNGTETWDPSIDKFLKEGVFASAAINPAGQCANLAVPGKSGVLNTRNQPWFADISVCLRNANLGARLNRVLKAISLREKFADGTSTAAAQPASAPQGKIRSYFSPEDNVEQAILAELSRTLENPRGSFAYIATNFITNRRLAEKLVEMHRAGVRMKIFFDRGRAEDANFQQQMAVLAPLGFTRGETGISPNVISVFDNSLTGPYGANHNKWAVIGTPQGMRTLNGSANWSAGAMTRNDENLVVIEDEALSSIFLREMLSQLFVYRYFQDVDSAGFREDLAFLESRAPCLKALLGLAPGCTLGGTTWQPAARSSAVLSVEGIPANPATETVWAWIPQLRENQGGAVQLFSHEVFAGKWLATVSLPVGWEFTFKLFKLPRGIDPNREGLARAQWEWPGAGNDRRSAVAPLGVHVVRERYTWGR